MVGRVRPNWAVLKNTFDQVPHVFSFIVFSSEMKGLTHKLFYTFLDLHMDIKEILMNFMESPETQVTAHQTYLAQNPKLRILQITTVRQYSGTSWGSFGRKTRIRAQKMHISSHSREFPSIMHCTLNFSGYHSWKEL